MLNASISLNVYKVPVLYRIYVYNASIYILNIVEFPVNNKAETTVWVF